MEKHWDRLELLNYWFDLMQLLNWPFSGKSLRLSAVSQAMRGPHILQRSLEEQDSSWWFVLPLHLGKLISLIHVDTNCLYYLSYVYMLYNDPPRLDVFLVLKLQLANASGIGSGFSRPKADTLWGLAASLDASSVRNDAYNMCLVRRHIQIYSWYTEYSCTYM